MELKVCNIFSLQSTYLTGKAYTTITKRALSFLPSTTLTSTTSIGRRQTLPIDVVDVNVVDGRKLGARFVLVVEAFLVK